MNNHTARVWVGALSVTVLVAGAGAVLVGLLLSMFDPHPALKKRLAEEVIAAVATGRLRPDVDGEVVLPSSLAAVSLTGRVYVNRGSRGLMLILFPTIYGHIGTKGYLYCSRPLTAADTQVSDGKQSIALRYELFPGAVDPRFRKLLRGRHLPRPLHGVEIEQLDTHWYEIYQPE